MQPAFQRLSRAKALLFLLLCASLLTACRAAGSAAAPASAGGGQSAPFSAQGFSRAAASSVAAASSAVQPPLCGLPRADDGAAAGGNALSLTLEQTSFPLPAGGEAAPELAYTVHNGTGETLGLIAVPLLERESGGRWEPVACDTAFCGTPDSLEAEREGVLRLSLYPALVPGTYRLSYRVVPGEGDALEQETWVRATFVLE